MTNRVPLLALLLCMASALPAQLQLGEIGATAFSTNEFGLFDTAGVGSTIAIGSFGGTGTSQAILWDPSQPDSFIIGGFGFVGRATLSGGTWSYAFIAAVGTAAQMSFDANGQIIVADALGDQVVSVDPATGVVTPIVTSGPWGASVNAGAVDPINGDIYVGGNGGLFRILAGTTTVQTIATGLGGFLSGITFDPFTNEVVVTVLTANRLVRFDAAGTPTDLGTGGITAMNSIAVDLAGDFVIGAANRTVYRVPNAGGSSTLIGSFVAAGASASGVAVVGVGGPSGPPEFQTNTFSASLFLNNTAGTGFVPATVTAALNTPVSWTLSTAIPGGSVFDLAIGTAPLLSRSAGAPVLPSGELLNIDLTDPTLVLLGGGFQTLLPLPGTLSGSISSAFPISWSFQMAVIDPALPGGVALSQPSRLEIQ